MTGWTYVEIDNNLRRMYETPCTTSQHRLCAHLGHCVKPYLSDLKAKKYFRLCRKITFRVLGVLGAFGSRKFMTINQDIKILGSVIRKK